MPDGRIASSRLFCEQVVIINNPTEGPSVHGIPLLEKIPALKGCAAFYVKEAHENSIDVMVDDQPDVVNSLYPFTDEILLAIQTRGSSPK